MRKGLVRLYIAIGVPWTIWFGYNFLEARPREQGRAFFSLLIVPIGGPLLLLLIVWIVNGFRKASPNTSVRIDMGHHRQSKDWRENAEKVRDTAVDWVSHKPDILCDNLLRTGDFFGKKFPGLKLDAEGLTTDQMAGLPKEYFEKGGVNPSVVAEQFGYPTADAMLDHLRQLHKDRGTTSPAEHFEKLVDREVERQMQRKFSDGKESQPSPANPPRSGNGVSPDAKAAKKTPTAMDALIKLSYGSSPPRKEECNLREAIELSFEQLLGKVVDIAEVRTIATGLYNSPMPQSTHGLAVATALNLYRSAKGGRHAELMHVQILARMIVLDWLKGKKVDVLLASAFEHSLYERYKLQI
jgi:hypothetical protein